LRTERTIPGLAKRRLRPTVLPRTLQRVDLALFRRVAATETPVLDVVLPKLSRAANRSLLWIGISGILWASENRFARRAALRGLIAIAITSAIANLPGKLLSNRQRPLIDVVPQARRLARVPASTSFPSGHAASAFAFAAGASLEVPALSIPLGILAVAVAYSRVYSGVHYPGDVVVGGALGVGVGMASRSFWPLAPHDAPAVRRTRVERAAAASTDGRGLTMAINTDAGPATSGSPLSELRRALPQANFVEIGEGDSLMRTLDAATEDSTALGIAGGDGSVNTAAQIAVDADKPLLVVPTGTLNHLARDIGLTDIAASVEALRSGRAIAIDVATIDGKVFLNTASFGAYTELVDAREKLEGRIGKWPAVVVALFRVLRSSKPIDLEIDGDRTTAWMAFIGNCRYHPEGFTPSWREQMNDGILDVRIVDDAAPWARTRLVLAVLTGRLARCRVYRQQVLKELRVTSLEGPIRLARDGETFDGSEDFVIEKLDRPLLLYVSDNVP
jgi:diacylglycerol kinase family enzyme/membrane-associated phospholipid phosphatase